MNTDLTAKIPFREHIKNIKKIKGNNKNKYKSK